MNAVDDELRACFERIFPLEDPSDVAAEVWARFEAGESGTPGRAFDLAAGSSEAASWVPWLGGAALIGVLSFGAASAGLFGHPSVAVAEAPLSAEVVAAAGYDCPGGRPIASLDDGSRVLALERTADGGWLLVRDPRDPARAIWVAAAGVALDSDADVSGLPVGDCLAAVAVAEATGEPSPVSTAPAAETPETDATAPVITTASVAYSPAVGYVCTENPESIAIVSALVSDDGGVMSVVAAWDGSDAGSSELSRNGVGWALTYHPDNLSITEVITFTLTATDAAGNSSSPAQVAVQRDQCPG